HDRGTDDDAALLNLRDRLLAPGIPVHDTQSVLASDRVDVDAEAAEIREGRIGRLRRDQDEPARSGLQALREEREGEAQFLLARRALQHDAGARGQATLDHGVKSRNARCQPRHANHDSKCRGRPQRSARSGYTLIASRRAAWNPPCAGTSPRPWARTRHRPRWTSSTSSAR